MEKCMYYRIGGMTIKVESDFHIGPDAFEEKFRRFQVDMPGDDNICLHHHLGTPFSKVGELGKELYFKPPWTIYQRDDTWVYVVGASRPVDDGINTVAVFNRDYSRGDIYHRRMDVFDGKPWHSLTLFPTDQVLLAQLLASREGVLLHSGAVILDGTGLMFIGHSGAGKSTTLKMLKSRAEVLCDDRNIVRRKTGGFQLYGSWSHGELPDVSSASAPLKALLFLKKSGNNRLVHIEDQREIQLRLLSCLIKPFLTAGWWDQSLALVENIASQVPCYEMEFDRSGDIVPELERLARGD